VPPPDANLVGWPSGIEHREQETRIRTCPTPWQSIILLCGKCARKLDGGYGPEKDATLRSALRMALKDAGHRHDVRIIETRCMGICPKKAVTAVNASRPETIFVVPVSTPPAEVLKAIGGSIS
jgi:predicted metal-binding protein